MHCKNNKKKKTGFSLNGKWNPVVFSRDKILSFYPAEFAYFLFILLSEMYVCLGWERVEDDWACTHTHTHTHTHHTHTHTHTHRATHTYGVCVWGELRICGEIFSAFRLRSLLSRGWYKVTWWHQILNWVWLFLGYEMKQYNFDFSNRSIWQIVNTITCTPTLVLSGSRSNGNKGIDYTVEIFRTTASLSDAVSSPIQGTLVLVVSVCE